ncbi:MAG: hypothetical protein OXJ52_02765 [Oligoflexia bacterium]|nr:hypothetical protein [Oligoflexia bacterium]
MWREFCIFISCFLFVSSCDSLRQDSLISDPDLGPPPSLLCGPSNESPPPSCDPSSSEDLIDGQFNKACQADEDCVLVITNCCSCRAGARYIAIHKSQENSYKSKRDKQCSSFNGLCSQDYTCGTYQAYQAQCLNSQCQILAKSRVY